jgi:hypothetical protein
MVPGQPITDLTALRLLKILQPAIPMTWTVFVLSDSGLYSKKLFQYLSQEMRWATFMRIWLVTRIV